MNSATIAQYACAGTLRCVGRRGGIPAIVSVLAAGVLAAPADPHPGHATPQVAIANHAFTPAALTVSAGDIVLFTWPGPDTTHSATADDGSFDTDSGKAPALVVHKIDDAYGVSFPKAGVYGFHCKVHPDMTGTITVQAVATQPTGPPNVTKLSASPTRLCDRRSHRCSHPGTRLSFSLSGPGDVRALITRRGHPRVVREVDFSAPPGPSRRHISFGALAPGRYRIALVAIDAATGTAGARRHIDVAVRR
jgi:plastocyanin